MRAEGGGRRRKKSPIKSPPQITRLRLNSDLRFLHRLDDAWVFGEKKDKFARLLRDTKVFSEKLFAAFLSFFGEHHGFRFTHWI
jgi:hypothetical protein